MQILESGVKLDTPSEGTRKEALTQRKNITKEEMAVMKYITAMTITNMQYIRTQKDL